jgi:KipI family sensor histidine kinase inhibitor
MEIVPLGDSALIVRVRDEFEDAPDQTLTEVLRTFRRLQDAAIPGVIELAPAYTTVAVFFNPMVIANAAPKPDQARDWLTERVREVVPTGANRGRRARSTRGDARLIEIPVCYDPEFALDLDHVASQAKLTPTKVVDLHSEAEYRVSCIGFVPGFPFLAGLPKELATPRRAAPRKEIPAGSVAIGGAQTGIYPLRSPGGWNLIGRTPLHLFDPERTPPAFLHAGDRVRFRAITREEFEALAP